jgi:hypothetical protein
LIRREEKLGKRIPLEKLTIDSTGFLSQPLMEYEQQWAPNTIKTVILICNAKGIPNAIAQKNCKTKLKNSSS